MGALSRAVGPEQNAVATLRRETDRVIAWRRRFVARVLWRHPVCHP